MHLYVIKYNILKTEIEQLTYFRIDISSTTGQGHNTWRVQTSISQIMVETITGKLMTMNVP